ncbi:unnamed protein product [Paramecium pentaurelia]|uniref:Lipid-binding serum glycoprotein C-terminal domain-containing protein n=1 Tax=Paramecium pentaurelia TaxID=43138 RepID=A0A8S1YAE1_9CILI|nr:unnamed protein product [Paramecium pentaurelia]
MNIILFTVLFFVRADHIPEFKAALDFNQINSFKQHILKPIITLIQGAHLPLDIQMKQSFPLIGKVELEINEVYLQELTLNWDDTFIMPYQNKEDSIILQLRQTNITIEAFTRLVFGGWQVLNTGTVFKLQNLDFSLVIQFDPTTSKRSWGFKPIIKYVDIALTRMQFIMDNVIIPPQAGINAFVDLLTPMIIKQTKKMILQVASPALGVLSQNQRLQIAQQLGDYMYQFQITFTQPPSVIYGQTTFMSLQLDIQIENVDTGNGCPIFDTGSLPNRVHSHQALELILGGNIIDQLLWLLIDSKKLDLTIDNSMLENIDLPISLTTNGMKLIIPDFYEAYGPDKGIYIRIYGQTAEQQMYIRSGRLLGAMTVMMDFIVDTNSSNYPNNKSDCESCVIAYTAEVELGVMVTLYNKSPQLFAASVMLVKIIDIDQTSGELLTVQQLSIMQTLNSLVGALLPSINQDLQKGIQNPFIGFFGLKEIDITMGDSFISLGVVLNE